MLPNPLEQLIQKYSADRKHYLSSAYNETQLRADFLDPFFEILGWDIKNTKGKPTNEREVLLEEPLKRDAASNTKKPDYTFRLFSERKFFLEAKKPSVKIDSDHECAKQVRRYGFTAKLKISVLSNFEHLSIYECQKAVDETDQVGHSRVKHYHYTEYLEKFDEIQKALGHEAVYSGRFDKTWEHIEEQLRTFSVDTLFLDQINEWRLILGREIFSHRPDLSPAQLNDIVQRYINSIIFLRVSEDRNLETYKTLLEIATADNHKALVEIFSQADRKYNSGLFNHEITREIIETNSSAFWTIIKQLYYPESTYSFSVFSSDILGNIYEIYLAQQLAIEDGEIILERKPDHKDRDIVTTPTYIIRDILRQTVVEYCKGKTDRQILESKFADIACGSGAFLLETFELLNGILIDFYLEHSPTRLIQTAISTYKLPFEIKRKVLEKCLFGVDKDFNAVEACKFGLLLKLLEDENNSSIPTPALPELSKVIHFGNSLLDSSDTDAMNRTEINPFDFGKLRFNVIVGNPPYMATEDIKKFTPAELPLLKEKYSVAHKQFDKSFLFIERGYELLAKKGFLGYIIPSKFAKVGAAKMLRRLLAKTKSIDKLISFGANQVFQDKTTYTCLLILQKEERDAFQYMEIKSLSDWKTRNLKEETLDPITYSELDNDGWILVPSKLKVAFEKINAQSIELGTLVGDENIYNGIQTSANPIYIHIPTKVTKHLYYFEKDGATWAIERGLTKPYFKTSGGTDNLNTYRPFKANAFVIYPYTKEVDGTISFVKIGKLKSEFPKAYEYLMAYKTKLEDPKRDIKPEPLTQNEWYKYGRHQSLDKCDVPAKIIVGVLSQGNKYAIDYSGTLISSGGTAGYCMITLPDGFPYSIYYIQALLNSKYLEWYAALIGEIFRGGYIARGTKVLKRLPIRTIDFKNAGDKNLHDRIASLQENLIKCQGDIDANLGDKRATTPLQRDLDRMKGEMSVALKDLYKLGESDSIIPLISEIYAPT
jgi:type I restriction-modification system DNA methylase subunit